MSKERMDDIKEAYEMNKYDENYGLGMKDIEWLIEQAERVHELEENNKNLKALRSINRKERMRIHDQNKRYREYLARLKRATNRYPAEDMAYVVNKITSEALEGDSDE